MGNFCEGCCRSDENSHEEAVSLIDTERSSSERGVRNGTDGVNGNRTSENGESRTITKEKRSAAYYQSIIDDANNKFISSSYRPYSGMDSEVEEIRTKLANATVDSKQMSSLPSKSISSLYAASSASTSGSLEQQVVLDTLSGPPPALGQMEVIIDEIAELVTSHAFALRIEEGTESVVVSKFKQ